MTNLNVISIDDEAIILPAKVINDPHYNGFKQYYSGQKNYFHFKKNRLDNKFQYYLNYFYEISNNLTKNKKGTIINNAKKSPKFTKYN